MIIAREKIDWERPHHAALWLVLCLAVAVSFSSISTQSLWIDEGNSAFRAIQPTISDFWSQTIRFGGSDLQMPGYMLSLWCWEKIFGPSEYALRAMNIPFLLITVYAVLFLYQETQKLRLLFALLICLSPMVWIYMDEARPYILQFAGSTLALIGATNQGSNPVCTKKNLALFCLGNLILCAASLIGVVFSFFFVLAYMVILLNQRKIFEVFSSYLNLFVLFSSLLVLLTLGAYYLWTLQMGVGASNASKTSFSSVAFAFYELLGFMGIGPGRLELRLQGVSALCSFFVGIGVFAFATLLVAASPVRKLIAEPPPSWVRIIAFACISGAATITALGILKDFRIVGRHMMPILPFLLLFLSWCLTGLWESKLKIKKTLVFIYLILLTTSSLSARIDTRFEKDDYRSAAKLAQSYLEQRKTVWWAADEPSLRYYLPEVEKHIASKSLFLAFGPRSTPIELRKNPNLVLLSKPDIYDPNKILLVFLVETRFNMFQNYKAFWAYKQMK